MLLPEAQNVALTMTDIGLEVSEIGGLEDYVFSSEVTDVCNKGGADFPYGGVPGLACLGCCCPGFVCALGHSNTLPRFQPE